MPKKMTAEDWNDNRVMLSVDPVMKEHLKKRMAQYGGTPQSWLLEGYRRQFMENPPPDLIVNTPPGMTHEFWKKKEEPGENSPK